MITKRIIPCLDVDHGNVKKGVNFIHLANVGDPVEIASNYEHQGADELVFLDITATNEKRMTLLQTVQKVAKQVFVPLTVGGGIKSIKDIQLLLQSGADKVAINSAALFNPELISQGAEKFGSQCIVLSIDAKWDPDEKKYWVYTNGGKKETKKDALDWAKEGVSKGAGELLVTSMDKDGTKKGYDINLYRALNQLVNVPIIASGGCGKLKDFINVFKKTNVDGALAASVFHFKELTIPKVKNILKRKGILVR